MPLDPYVAQDLLAWRAVSPYPEEDDYVFASLVKKGKQPLWPHNVMVSYIRPVAKSVGITKRIGWHTFRHTYSTLLKANRGDVKTVQELMRHASARTSMDVYTQAIPEPLRAAQSKIVNLIRSASNGSVTEQK